MNAGLRERTSIKGVTCHECRDWIRKGKIYFQYEYHDYGMRKYTNYCVKCAFLTGLGYVNEMQKIVKLSKKLIKKYSADDRKLCLTCIHRYRQVVGECAPNRPGCRPQTKKDKKNENRKSTTL